MTKQNEHLGTLFLAAALLLPQVAEARKGKHDSHPRKEKVTQHKPAAPAPSSSAFATAPDAVVTEAQKKEFRDWLEKTREEAARRGISQRVLDDALPLTLEPAGKVLSRHGNQPHKKATLAEYIEKTVSPEKIDNGRKNYAAQKPLLDSVGAAYGVAPEILASLWGNESNYGSYTGKFNVVASLATLAAGGASPKRQPYFREELFNALDILQRENMPSADLKGSWAGALGQCQFMPSNYNTYTVDYDGDGKRDIWNTPADVFASSANFLRKLGWEEEARWGRLVKLPEGFDGKLVGLDKKREPLDVWNKRGVRLMDGSPIPTDDTRGTASLTQPDNKGTQVYLVYKNFEVLKRWNNADAFAISVGTLADKIAEAPAPSSLPHWETGNPSLPMPR